MPTILHRFKILIRPFHLLSSRRHLHRPSHAHSKPETYGHNLKLRSLVRSGKFEAARKLFDHMPERDVVTWNTMIAACWERNDVNGAEWLFGSMPERSVVSWNCMVAGHIETGRIEEAFKYFLLMPERSIASWNAMISGLVKHDRFDEAERLFNEMPDRNVISYTAMVDGFTRKGEIERARSLFDRIACKNVVSWAVMISGYVENRKLEEARRLFDQMPEKSVVAFTAMITGYCKEGDMEGASILFEELRHKDLISWNVMIAGYAQNNHGEEALRFHQKMVTSGRAGKLEKAYHLIMTMPCEADSAVWGALLGACRMYFNVEFGELAANKMLELDPHNSGAYVMLSNIYAAAGMWRDVTRVRLLMKDQGVQKQGGYSWTEIGDKLHMFMGGDVLHPDIGKIHSELKRISLHMNTRNFDTNIVS